MKHILISVLFIVFAAVQWNDPDAHIWIPVYLVVAIVAFLGFRGRYYSKPYLALSAILVLWMATYLPHIYDWVIGGMPNIAGSMKAESPFIELTREFFGLLICFAAIWYYYIQSKKVKDA